MYSLEEISGHNPFLASIVTATMSADDGDKSWQRYLTTNVSDLVTATPSDAHTTSHHPTNVNGVLFESPKGMWIIIDGIISLLAIIANVAFIGAIRNVKLDLKGYRIFLINLSATNIFTAFVCLLNFFQQAIASYTHSMILEKCASSFLRSLNIASMLSNLFSLFGMSVDHYIGIVHPLRYHQIMGKSRRIKAAVAIVWVFSMMSALVDTLLLFLAYDATTRNKPETAPPTLSSQDVPDVPDIIASLVKTTSTPPESPLISVTKTAEFIDVMHSGQIAMRSGFVPTSTPSPIHQIISSSGRMMNDSSFSSPSAPAKHLNLLLSGGQDSMFFEDVENMFETDSIRLVTDSREINDTLAIAGNYSTNPLFPQIFWDSDGEDPVAHFMKMFISNDSETIAAYFDKILHNEEAYLVSWCSYYASETLWFELIVIGMTVLVFGLLVPIYYQTLKHMVSARVEQDWNAHKLVMTTLFLLGAFLLCRVPFVMFEVSMVILMRIGYMRTNDSYLVTMLLNNALNTLLMFYPLIDPMIYTLRMRAVQRYLAWKVRKMMPLCLQRHVTPSIHGTASGQMSRIRSSTSIAESSELHRASAAGARTSSTCIDRPCYPPLRSSANSNGSSRPLLSPVKPIISRTNSSNKRRLRYKKQLPRPIFEPLTSYVDAATLAAAAIAHKNLERRRSSRWSPRQSLTPAALNMEPVTAKQRRRSSAWKPLISLNRRLSLFLSDPPLPVTVSVATSTADGDGDLALVDGMNNNHQQKALDRWTLSSAQRKLELTALMSGVHKRTIQKSCPHHRKQLSRSTPDLSMLLRIHRCNESSFAAIVEEETSFCPCHQPSAAIHRHHVRPSPEQQDRTLEITSSGGGHATIYENAIAENECNKSDLEDQNP